MGKTTETKPVNTELLFPTAEPKSCLTPLTTKTVSSLMSNTKDKPNIPQNPQVDTERPLPPNMAPPQLTNPPPSTHPHLPTNPLLNLNLLLLFISLSIFSNA